MILGLGHGLGFGGRVAWSPSALGASLLGFWDAERADLITQSGGSVSSWRDTVAGYDAVQALSASKPTYSATSFNSRPGITFDGTDDELTLASVPFPTGANACEVWFLADQTALPADTTVRLALSYGGGGSATARRFGRGVTTGVNRATTSVGNGGSAVGNENSSVDFSGRKVFRGVVSATNIRTDVDAIAGGNTAVVPATGTTRTRIGASDAGTAAGFYKGVISAIAITAPLDATQATQLYTYLNARKA